MSNSIAINYTGHCIKLPCCYHRFYKKWRILKAFIVWKYNLLLYQKPPVINKPVISIVKLIVAIFDKSFLRKNVLCLIPLKLFKYASIVSIETKRATANHRTVILRSTI